MIKRKATQAGNPIIRKKSSEVKDKDIVSQIIKKIVRDLTDSMRFHGLVGMAAPQIGVNLRIFVTEIRKTKVRRKQKKIDPLRVYINPRILSSSKKQSSGYEGCGSVAFAQLFGPVKRAETLVVEAYDEQRRKFKVKATGLLARVIQHELDHLTGILFIDKVGNTKKLMSKDEYVRRFH